MHRRECARLPVAFFVGVHSAFVASFLIAQYDCAVCEKVTIAAEGFALGLLSPLAKSCKKCTVVKILQMLPKFDDGMRRDCQNMQVLSKFNDRTMCAYQILASATQV